MPFSRKQRPNKLTRGIKGLISFFALFLAVGLLLFQLISSILLATNISSLAALRSAAAAIFPLTIAIYFGFLAQLKIPAQESKAPIINNFVIYLFWSMILFGLDSVNDLVQFPLEELLYSTTLAGMIWRYKQQDSFQALLACCYGVLSGALAAVILFGMNPARL
jgi:hypothetical protein